MYAGYLKRFFSSSPSKYLQQYDCIISGGGMVGTAMACSLANSSLLNKHKVLLIEAGSRKEWNEKSNYSNRVSAINSSTRRFLEKIGVWKNIETSRYHIVEDIKVWGFCSANSTYFSDSEEQNLMYIVENDVIVNAAYKVLSSSKNIDILYDSQVEEVVQHPNGLPELKLRSGEVYSCLLLIGADGANSKVRSSMNPHILSWSYKQFAIVATLNILTDDSENNIAWQRFLPDGPIAILPLSKTMSSLVWSTSIEKSKELMNLPEEEFVNAVNDALTKECEKNDLIDLSSKAINPILNALNFNTYNKPLNPPFVKSVHRGSRAAFPLGFSHSSKYVDQRLVLVGDAAHKVHPLAGQGVNLGFSDVHNLATALDKGIQLGRPFGHKLDLMAYEQKSLLHNTPIMLAIDLLHRLYVSNSSLLKAAGDICFRIAGSVPPVNFGMKMFASGSM